MKMIFIDWHCFHREATIHAFEKMGYEVVKFAHPDYNATESVEFKKYFETAAKGAEFCFSYNFFPLTAACCHDLGIKYISVIYDSPYVYLYSYTIMYPTNHVFLFDSSWVEEMNKGGLTNVRYIVLPGDPGKLETALPPSSRQSADISFVGALYNEAHNFYDRFLKKAKDSEPDLVGYLDGIIEAQSKVYGYPLITELVTSPLIDRIRPYLPLDPDPTCVEPLGYRYTSYFLERRLTSLERQRMLAALGEKLGGQYKIKLFTLDKEYRLKGVENCGIAEYEHEMARVFHDSRININISLRSIHTGIPLRCMDIMSCGGFLLSNYQADFAPDFVPGEDYDFFSSQDELLEKCEYYLSHEKDREEIAKNGYEKVKALYTIDAVISRCLKESGI